MNVATFPTVDQMTRFIRDVERRGVNPQDVSVLHYGRREGAQAHAQDTAQEVVRRARTGGEDGLTTGAGIGALTGLGLGALLVTAGPLALAPLLGIAAIGAGTGAVSGLVAGMVGGAGSAVVDSLGQEPSLEGERFLSEEGRAVARRVMAQGGGVVAFGDATLNGLDLLSTVQAYGGHLL